MFEYVNPLEWHQCSKSSECMVFERNGFRCHLCAAWLRMRPDVSIAHSGHIPINEIPVRHSIPKYYTHPSHHLIQSPPVLSLGFFRLGFGLLLLPPQLEKGRATLLSSALKIAPICRSPSSLHVWYFTLTLDFSRVDWEKVLASRLLPISETARFEWCDAYLAEVFALVFVGFGFFDLSPLFFAHAASKTEIEVRIW